MSGMYSSDEKDNLHNEAPEDGLTYADVYGETYEQTCANYAPWQAEQDAMDYELNARHDYVSEANAGMIEDNSQEAYYDALDDGFTGTFAEWKADQAAKYALRLLSPEYEASLHDLPF